jgi:Putative prokaryotic signal transducing protein
MPADRRPVKGLPVIRIYTAQTAAMVAPVKDHLEANGIPCVLRNEFLSAGRGELPPIECWPEVWVADDSDAQRARQLVAEATQGPDPAAEPWRCARCGEEVEAVFAQCWKCGAEQQD